MFLEIKIDIDGQSGTGKIHAEALKVMNGGGTTNNFLFAVVSYNKLVCKFGFECKKIIRCLSSV